MLCIYICQMKIKEVKKNIKGDIVKTLPEATGIPIENLMTLPEYARKAGKTPARLYQMLRDKTLTGATAYRKGNMVLIAVN